MKKWIFTGVSATIILIVCFFFVRPPEESSKPANSEPEKTLAGTSTTASPYIHKIIGDLDIWNMCEGTEHYTGDILDFSNTPYSRVRSLRNKYLQQIFFIEKDFQIISVVCADAKLLPKPKSTKSVINGQFIFRTQFGYSFEMDLKKIDSFLQVQNPDALDYIDDNFLYLTDGINVYYQQGTSTPTIVLIEGADPKTFKIEENEDFFEYGFDANSIYVAGKRYLVDRETFKPLIWDIYSDKNGYYRVVTPYLQARNVEAITPIKEEDIYTIKPLTPTSTDPIGITGYVINGLSVYYGPVTPIPTTSIKEADPESLVIMRNNNDGTSKYGTTYRYAKDRNHVYYEGSVIAGADPETFEPAELRTTSSYWRYTKDKNYVYYTDRIIADADPKTFTTLSRGEGYAKDKSNVYYTDAKIKDADFATFSIIGDTQNASMWWADFLYARDKNNIYYTGKIIKGADLDSFKVIEGRYSKDKRGFYVSGVFDPSLPLDFVPPYEGEG